MVLARCVVMVKGGIHTGLAIVGMMTVMMEGMMTSEIILECEKTNEKSVIAKTVHPYTLDNAVHDQDQDQDPGLAQDREQGGDPRQARDISTGTETMTVTGIGTGNQTATGAETVIGNEIVIGKGTSTKEVDHPTMMAKEAGTGRGTTSGAESKWALRAPQFKCSGMHLSELNIK